MYVISGHEAQTRSKFHFNRFCSPYSQNPAQRKTSAIQLDSICSPYSQNPAQRKTNAIALDFVRCRYSQNTSSPHSEYLRIEKNTERFHFVRRKQIGINPVCSQRRRDIKSKLHLLPHSQRFGKSRRGERLQIVHKNIFSKAWSTQGSSAVYICANVSTQKA